MSMGSRIRQARENKGYTQEYVAERLGVSRQAVFKWEKDRTKPDTANLVALSELLGITTDHLLRGDKSESVKKHRYSGEVFFRAAIIPLLLLPLCWLTGIFSGAYTEMVQIPIDNGLRIGLPLLMYGHSPFAIVLAVVSIVSLLLIILLLFLGCQANKDQ